MKRVTVFETRDGEIHRTEKEATDHETVLAFEFWYQNNKLGDMSESYVGTRVMREWLVENEAQIAGLLGLKRTPKTPRSA